MLSEQHWGLTVIAEGVKIEGQRHFLARHVCHAYQGYLFSKPLPPEGFEAFAKRRVPDAQDIAGVHSVL